MTTRLPQVDEQIETKEESDLLLRLVVFNDNFNTFDHVILSFMEVLGYDEIRSEQLAYNIHNTGQATVKAGNINELVPFCDALCERKLDARIC
jgi:ATP-dependent Clp protease adaptor protein ClpS